MIKHGQRMSQALADMHLNELKMNDPKLNKVFDKLKPKATVQLKTSSTIAKGEDFKTYLVVSKNTLRNGVEKITLKNRANPTGVKSFLYRRDDKVTFAIGDMGASIDDIKEKYSLINHEIIEEIEVEELDEVTNKFAIVSVKSGDVLGFSSHEKDANDMARNNLRKEKGKVVKLKRGIATNRASKMIGRPLEMGMAEAIDPADLDLDATDADKKAADKNIIMQMRKAMDVRGNMPIEFANGKKEKVDAKILDMMTKAHMNIEKPRDKDKFVAMISKSKRDMLNVAKKLATLKMGEELELDEKFQSRRPSSKEVKMAIGIANDPRYKQGNYTGAVKAIEKIRDGLSDYPEVAAALRKANENLEEGKMKDLLIKAQDLMGPSKNREQGIEFVMKGLKVSKKEATKLVDAVIKMSENLDEKYDLYHKTFSDAMQHAYDYAKKKLGITVDSKEIDSKVATGPKKPSEGKTNKYRLKGKGGNLQIQVYNKGGSKPFELNMYKEENEMTKSLKDTIVDMWSEAVSPAQQAAIAISKKEKEEQDEGNAFGAALQAARENGDETFVVSGKTYKCEDYDEKGQVKETNKNNKSDDGDGMDAVQPKAVKKKFKDRKDKDIDNDGDVDDSDKFLHKRRKAVSKAINSQKESIERYHETKKGSLRDAVLQMWGEKHTPDHKEDEKNEKKSLTKEKKDGSVKKMTDTGKEVTPVETSVKMPKIKETNNKV